MGGPPLSPLPNVTWRRMFHTTIFLFTPCPLSSLVALLVCGRVGMLALLKNVSFVFVGTSTLLEPKFSSINQVTHTRFLFFGSYDVYTPTRNIVFHDYGKQPNGHGENEWFKRQRDRFRKETITRAKTMLQLPGGETDANDQANLGLYGLGKRRSLAQLSEFANIDLKNLVGNAGAGIKCSGHVWVPYDTSVSPQENLFTNPDNLDPQPEFPMRTKLEYYRQVEQVIPLYDVDLGDNGRKLPGAPSDSRGDPFDPDQNSNLPSSLTLFVFWVFGLIVWYVMFMGPSKGGKSQNGSSRKKTGHLYKDV